MVQKYFFVWNFDYLFGGMYESVYIRENYCNYLKRKLLYMVYVIVLYVL